MPMEDMGEVEITDEFDGAPPEEGGTPVAEDGAEADPSQSGGHAGESAELVTGQREEGQ